MASKHLHIGYRLKKHRKIMGYSIRIAARKIHVSPSRLSEWERGLRKPSIENLVKLAVLYKVLIDQLCFDLRKEEIKKSSQQPNRKKIIHSKIEKEKPT